MRKERRQTMNHNILITTFADQRSLRHIIIFRCANCKSVILKTQIPLRDKNEAFDTLVEVLDRIEDMTSELPHICSICGMPIGEPKRIKGERK